MHTAGPIPCIGLKGFLATVLSEVSFGSDQQCPLKETINCYFTLDHQQRVNGKVLNYDQFVDHIRHLRTHVASGRIEIVEALREGNRITDRHRVHITKSDGSAIQLEVFLFGELAADGRICRMDEVSRVIVGTTSDANLGF